MSIEPWKIMVGLSVLLAFVLLISSVGSLSPGNVLLGFVLLIVFVVTSYVGYRMGMKIVEGKTG